MKKIVLVFFFFSEIINFSGFLIHFVGCCGQQQSFKLDCHPTDFTNMLIIIATDDANVRRIRLAEGYSLN